MFVYWFSDHVEIPMKRHLVTLRISRGMEGSSEELDSTKHRSSVGRLPAN